jgi:hypothetical protein
MSAWNNPDRLSKYKNLLMWGGYSIAFLGLISSVTGQLISKRIDTLLHPPLAVSFRTLLAEINPDILKAIDSGKRQFSVLVDGSNMVRLAEMMREKGFNAVASIQVTSNVMIASQGSSIGQDFTDIHNTGQQTLCIFTLPHEDAP